MEVKGSVWGSSGQCEGQGVSVEVRGSVWRSRRQCGGQGVSVEVKGSVRSSRVNDEHYKLIPKVFIPHYRDCLTFKTLTYSLINLEMQRLFLA